MKLLVTGGTGFAMSVLGRQWLESDPRARLTVLDAAPLDAAAVRYFEPVADRLNVVVADILKPNTWRTALHGAEISHIVHGATITPVGGSAPGKAKVEPEAENPARVIDVNTMGTVAILEWARTQPAIQRFIYVSSGAVYLNHGPNRPGEPLPEDGYVMPRKLYGISKLASELIVERYGELFGLPTTSVRPSSVYGPMDRVTASRNFRHIPNTIAHMAVDGIKCVRVNTIDAVGDYLHAEDLAQGIIALLKTPRIRFSAYNIAAGVTATVGDLVQWAAEKAPGFHAEISSSADAHIVQNPVLRDGMWGAYDVSRITAETGWKPRPTREGLHAYMDWIRAERKT
jgi:UDP-glucose 4-epimerase